MIKQIKRFIREILNYLSKNFNVYRIINLFNKSAHQYNNTTYINRYPLIFNRVKEINKNQVDLKIVSFGCSTGEECYTLLEYFPNAKVVGVDINPLNLKLAKEKYANSPAISFLHSDVFLKNNQEQYDIIFCMSVLCRWEDTKNINNCSKVYPFDMFESVVTKIDKKLKREGQMIIYNSNFQFTDTALSINYKALEFEDVTESGMVHKFDKECNKLFNINYPYVVFKKIQ